MIYIQTLADIFGAGYFLFDHPLYFTKMGFVTTWSVDKQWNYEWTSELSWLLQCFLEVILHIVSIGDM